MRLRFSLLVLLVLCLCGSTANAGFFKKLRNRTSSSCASGSCSSESIETAVSNGPGFTSVSGFNVKQLPDGRTIVCNERGCQVVSAAGSFPKLEPSRSPDTITIDGRAYRLVPISPP